MTDQELQEEAKKDRMLQIAKSQGYVPEGCYLRGQLVVGLTNSGKDPCEGCNNNRSVCKGRPR